MWKKKKRKQKHDKLSLVEISASHELINEMLLVSNRHSLLISHFFLFCRCFLVLLGRKESSQHFKKDTLMRDLPVDIQHYGNAVISLHYEQ